MTEKLSNNSLDEKHGNLTARQGLEVRTKVALALATLPPRLKERMFQEGESKHRLVAFLYHLTFSQGSIKRPQSQNLEPKDLFIFSDCTCLVDIL